MKTINIYDYFELSDVGKIKALDFIRNKYDLGQLLDSQYTLLTQEMIQPEGLDLFIIIDKADPQKYDYLRDQYFNAQYNNNRFTLNDNLKIKDEDAFAEWLGIHDINSHLEYNFTHGLIVTELLIHSLPGLDLSTVQNRINDAQYKFKEHMESVRQKLIDTYESQWSTSSIEERFRTEAQHKRLFFHEDGTVYTGKL